MWADPDMGAILTIKGLVWGGAFSYFSRCREKLLAHLLGESYEVMKALVCEKLFPNININGAMHFVYCTLLTL